MCDALRDLMKDEFIKERNEGRVEGEIKGVILLYHDEMNLNPSEIILKIMNRFNLKKEIAEKYVEETLGSQLV